MRREQDQFVAAVAQRLYRARQRVGRPAGDLDRARPERDAILCPRLEDDLVDERRPASGRTVGIRFDRREVIPRDVIERRRRRQVRIADLERNHVPREPREVLAQAREDRSRHGVAGQR